MWRWTYGHGKGGRAGGQGVGLRCWVGTKEGGMESKGKAPLFWPVLCALPADVLPAAPAAVH